MPETNDGKIQTLLKQAAQQKHSPTDGVSSVVKAERVFSTADEAERAFFVFKKRLFRIGQWNEFSEFSSFELFDENGAAAPKKIAAVGDFVKVKLPGSGKDDWIKVSRIDETPEEMVLVVRPSRDPTDERNANTTSHFFTGDSTNNFCLQKKDARIIFRVIGLNEKTNTQETSGVLETVRNLATANIGCFLGIQKKQWETFCKNFIASER